MSAKSPSAPTDQAHRRFTALAVVLLVVAIALQVSSPGLAIAQTRAGVSPAASAGSPARHLPHGPLSAGIQLAIAKALHPGGSRSPVQLLPANVRGPRGELAISSAVRRFLTTDLGVALPSGELVGVRYQRWVVVTAGAPSAVRLGLPSGDAAPVLNRTELIGDLNSGTLTVSATSTAGTATGLGLTIADADTATEQEVSGIHGVFDMPVVPVLGGDVAFQGSVSFPAAIPTFNAVGYDTARTHLSADVLVQPDLQVRYDSASGFAIAGSATLGTGHHRLPVDISGAVHSLSTWRLAATAASRTGYLSVAKGLGVEGGFAGSVSDSSGDVTFSVTSAKTESWSPLASTSEIVHAVVFSDSAPTGASGLPAGTAAHTPWVLVGGEFSVSAGLSGVLAAGGSIGLDLVSGHGFLRLSSSSGLAISGSAELRDVSLSGNLTLGPTRFNGSLTGGGAVMSIQDGHTHSTERASLTLVDGDLTVSYDSRGRSVAWSADAGPSSSAAPAAPGRTPGPQNATSAPTATTTGTYEVSAAVLAYLRTTLGIGIGTSRTLTGTLSGSTLTITSATPTAVKIKLPTGATALTLGAVKITINETTNALTLTSNASASNGESASLLVTIPDANTSAVTATSGVTTQLAVRKIVVFGLDASFSGKLPLSGAQTYSLLGSLPAGASPGSDASLLLPKATLGLTSAGALSLWTTALAVGSGPTAVSVDVSGSTSNLSAWTLKVTDPKPSPWQPISGLTVTPDFTGTITVTGTTVILALTATVGGSPVTWLPGANTSMAVSGLTLSNQAPPASVSCNALPAGGIWLGVNGSLTYDVLNASAVTIPGEACVVLGSTVYTTTTTATGSFTFGGSLFSIGSAQLVVSGDTASNTFSVTGTAQLQFLSSPSLQVSIDFSSTGAFIAAIGLSNLSELGIKAITGTGAVWVSTEDIAVFDPSTMPGLPAAAPFHLRKGVSLTYTYTMDPTEVADLRGWGIPVPSTVQAVAALSADGFTIELDLGFGAGNTGDVLFSTDPTNTSDPNALALYLNDITIAITLGASSSIELDGVATLYVPAITGGSDSQATSIIVTLSSTFALDSGNFTVGIALTGNCGGGSCPWQNAFGIPGLTIGVFGANIGVDFESGIPTPTFSFSLDDVTLPSVIAGPIGLQPTATISIDVNFDLTAPVLNLQLSAAPGSPALLPLEITGQQAIENAIVIDSAGIWFAPIGGTLGNGTTVAPGIAVDFNATIAGVVVDVDAQVSPSTLTISAYVMVSPFNIGPIQFGQAGEPPIYLNLSISPQGFNFEFEGDFTAPGFTFYADITLEAVASFGGASVTLQVTAGLPQWLELSGYLYGSVGLDSQGNLDIAASGSGSIVVAGVNLGSASFSWSYEEGGIWQAITAAADQVAAAFENAYGWTADEVTQALNSLEYGVDSIASALQSAFANLSPDQIAQELSSYVTSSETAIAGALQSAGYSLSQIAQTAQDLWGQGQAAVEGVLQSIGADAWEVLNALNSVFTSGWNGTYYLSITPQGSGVQGAPLFMDVSGGSTSPGAQVIDYPWDGGANQHWYFESLGNGYAYIVNENSGQCLTVPGSDSTPGAPIQQWPCNGSPEEEWSMDIAQDNPLGPSVYIFNAYDGLVVDGAGASWFSANLDQWPVNYNWNQEWTISPGIF